MSFLFWVRVTTESMSSSSGLVASSKEWFLWLAVK